MAELPPPGPPASPSGSGRYTPGVVLGSDFDPYASPEGLDVDHEVPSGGGALSSIFSGIGAGFGSGKDRLAQMREEERRVIAEKSAGKATAAERKEMNKAYNAKLSVSLGKLAWHLTGGRVTRKAKEAYGMLTLPQQAAVSGIGSFALTMVSAEAARFVVGGIGERVGVDMPGGPSRWSELAIAAVVGVGMAAYGPIKANGLVDSLKGAGEGVRKGVGSTWNTARGAGRGLRASYNKGREIGDGLVDRARDRGRRDGSESGVSKRWNRLSQDRKDDIAKRGTSPRSGGDDRGL